MKEVECQELVRKCWARREIGDVSSQWVKKINDCCSGLIRWSGNKFKRQGMQIRDLLAQLDELQKDWGPNITKIKEKYQLIDDLRAQKESFWHQKSSVFFRANVLVELGNILGIPLVDNLGTYLGVPVIW